MQDLITIFPGLCFVRPLPPLRTTPSVEFNAVPMIEGLSAIDRVKHFPGAFSPSVAGSEDRPWYMHPDQEDNLLVCHGLRIVELYSAEHGKMERFEVTPNELRHEGKVVYSGLHIFGWPVDVFHRVHSPEGSVSLNFARHFVNFDIKTNFNIYDLDVETGAYQVRRAGHLDQPAVSQTAE
jgi:hypothetical protein